MIAVLDLFCAVWGMTVVHSHKHSATHTHIYDHFLQMSCWFTVLGFSCVLHVFSYLGPVSLFHG